MQSTSEILKVIKCSLFLRTHKWPNGRARLKTLNRLPDEPHEVIAKTPEGEEDTMYTPCMLRYLNQIELTAKYGHMS